MILEGNNIKRLVIYFIYDKQGIVDDYIPYMLRAIKEVGSEIEVVCNGKLTPESRDKLEEITPNIMVRENKGFDVWAYKSVLDYYGWEKLENYDEIIMMNFTIMGPVYPLQEMFDTMNRKDLDFWGITRYHLDDRADPFGTIEYGYIPEHIQSHFIAVRNPMIKSLDFQNYWNEMPMIHNYQEAIGFHEAIFTKKFTEAGFVCDVYADLEDDYNDHPILCGTTRMLKEKRCPIFKRRSFMQEYAYMLYNTFGQEAIDVVQYLKDHTDYDTKMIWDNILRVENMADIKKNLQLNYVIDEKETSNRILTEHKAAVWLGIADKEHIPFYMEYFKKIPKEITLILIPKTIEIKEELESYEGKGLSYLVLECADTAIEAALTMEKQRVREYEYVCFMQDMDIRENVPYSQGASFLYSQFCDLLSQGSYASKVVELFETQERLGLLVAPLSPCGEIYGQIGNGWGKYYHPVLKLAKKIGVEVAIQYTREPIMAMENMFWVRTSAWKNILEHTWERKDFRKETEEQAGMLQTLMRMHAYAVQQQGYYTGTLMSQKGAAIHVTNSDYVLEEFNKMARDIGISIGNREEAMYLTKSALQDWRDYILEGATYFNRTKLYVKIDGQYAEENTYTLKWNDEKCRYITEELTEYKNVEELRWDPGERAGITLQDFRCIVEDVEGKEHIVETNQIITNGISRGNQVYFLKKDPQVYIKLPCKMQIKKLTIFVQVIDEVPYEAIVTRGGRRSIRELFRAMKRKMKRLLQR